MVKKINTGLEGRIIRFLNTMSLRRKLTLLYVVCVIIPLILTDGFIIGTIYLDEKEHQRNNMQNVADNIATDLENVFDYAIYMSNSMYVNYKLNTFLDTEFESNASFYQQAREWFDQTYYSSYYGTEISQIILYADNDTIVNGGNFSQLGSVRESNWYQEFVNSGSDNTLIFYYMGDDDSIPVITLTRKISLVRKLNYFSESDVEKVLKINIDYSRVAAELTSKRYGMLAYICDGDRILMSTDGRTDIYSPFGYITSSIRDNIGCERTVSLLGREYTIYVTNPSNDMLLEIFGEHIFTVLLLIMLNILLPIVIIRFINASFTDRLKMLTDVFKEGESEVGLKTFKDVDGTDEIADLIHGYNGLVRNNRQLIKTIYEDRLRHQEVEIEKQQAELLSMHMQINPHFMFNVLESIRMHSIIRNEKETASMIERLAALERDIVEWKDIIPLENELAFIRNYLKLQQYRFGDRFKFTIDADDAARKALIPKLTLATFVENSCVHGIEKKSSDGMIIIDASVKENRLIIEIEDTGVGMNSVLAERMQVRMKECTFADLQKSRHIGILNACLRIKMISGDDASFVFESEENVGTYLRIDMPLLGEGDINIGGKEDE